MFDLGALFDDVDSAAGGPASAYRAVVDNCYSMAAVAVDKCEVVVCMTLSPRRESANHDSEPVPLLREHVLLAWWVLSVGVPSHDAVGFQQAEARRQDSRGDSFNRFV